MFDRGRGQGQAVYFGEVAVVQLVHLKRLLERRRAGIAEEVTEPFADPGRPVERQRLRWPEIGEQQRVHGRQQVGDVVGVQVRNPDGVDVGERGVLLQRGEGAGAASSQTVAPSPRTR